MDYKEKLAESKKCFDEARALLEKKDKTAEETAKIKTLMDAGKALQLESVQLKEIESAAVALEAEAKVDEAKTKEKDADKPETEETKGNKGWNKDWAA